jgi:mRNA interferase MazF
MLAAIREGIGRHIENAHHEGAAGEIEAAPVGQRDEAVDHSGAHQRQPRAPVNGRGWPLLLRLVRISHSFWIFQMVIEIEPRRAPMRIKAAPKIRSIYWCDFPEDAHFPELWKTRPVLVVSYRNALYGAVTVLPMSTAPQDDNPWAVRIILEAKERPSWIICDKPSTVATSRLSPLGGKVPRLPKSDFELVLRRLLDWLPRIEAI